MGDHWNKMHNNEITNLKQEHAQKIKELQDNMERKANTQRVKSERKVNGMLDAVKKEYNDYAQETENTIKQLTIEFKDEIEALQNENETKTHEINTVNTKLKEQKDLHDAALTNLKEQLEDKCNNDLLLK